MSDEWKALIAVGQSFAAHETVQHARREYVRGPVHANSVEGFNLRVRRTVSGVFHHISPRHADLYFHEIGFRWSHALSWEQSSVEPGASGRKSKRSGRVCRRLSDCHGSSGPQRDARSAVPALAASPSNQPSLSLVYKSDVQIRAALVVTPTMVERSVSRLVSVDLVRATELRQTA